MRYVGSEEVEIVCLVETSPLPVRRALAQIGIPKSTFYAQVTSVTWSVASRRWRITGRDRTG